MKAFAYTLGITCLLFISCKKSRTCNCTVTTNENTTIRNQTSGTSFSLLGTSLVLVPPSDTTVTTFHAYSTVEKRNYDKVSKKTMRGNCASSYQTVDEDSYVSLTAGTSTVTTNKSVTKKYACTIE